MRKLDHCAGGLQAFMSRVTLVIPVTRREGSTQATSSPCPPPESPLKTNFVRSVSDLATATVIPGASLLSGMQQPSGEKQDILRHMTFVYLPDGLGGRATTMLFTGVNMQVVNRVGLLIVNNCTSFGGIVGPRDSMTSAPCASVTGASENLASTRGASVRGGRSNTATGDHSPVSGGILRSVSHDHNCRGG